MDEAHKLLEEAARQPVQYWGAALVIGCSIVAYISVRRLVNSLREQNEQLRDMLREKELRLTELNNKLVILLEEQRKKRGPQ